MRFKLFSVLLVLFTFACTGFSVPGLGPTVEPTPPGATPAPSPAGDLLHPGPSNGDLLEELPPQEGEGRASNIADPPAEEAIGEFELMAEVRVGGGRPFEKGVLAEGERLHLDARDAFTYVPPVLSGLEFIRTTGAEPEGPGPGITRFTLKEEAVVYVLHEAGGENPAGWLERDGWRRLPNLVLTDEASHRIYQKRFSAGEVIIGEGSQRLASDRVGAYTVAAGAEKAGSSAPAPAPESERSVGPAMAVNHVIFNAPMLDQYLSGGRLAGYVRPGDSFILVSGKDTGEIDAELLNSWGRVLKEEYPEATLLAATSGTDNVSYGSPHLDRDLFGGVMVDYEPGQENAPGFTWNITEAVSIWRGMADEIEDSGLEAWGRPTGRSLPGSDHYGDWDYGVLASIMGGLNVQTHDSCGDRNGDGNYAQEFKEAVEGIVYQYRMAGASSLLFVELTTSSSAAHPNAILPEKAFKCAMAAWAYPEVEAVTLWSAIEGQESTDRVEEFLQLRDQALVNQNNPPAPQPDPGPQSVPNSVFTLPGRIEAEDYKSGGDGVGYHDNDAGNTGGEYRSDDVDIQSTSDNGDSYEVMRAGGGEWLAFDVEVRQSGTYSVTARVASGSDRTKSFHVEVDGQDVTGAVSFDDSEGYDTFVDVKVEGVSLRAGRHELRFVMHTGYFSLNYLDLALSTPVKESPLLVDAGSDLTITLPEYATLEGTFSYNGLSNPPGTFSIQWNQVNGPGAVSFADPAVVDTVATFSRPGDYVLKLTIGDGNISSSDQVTVTVTATPDPAAAPTPVPDTPPEEEPVEGPGGVVFYEGSPFTYVTNPRTDMV
ncbi:MAG TPA: carbohydrate-binding protein, partial [Dehalococcoidia bacterium]|nr:carbohydrate-binding protein [Dehalococcoidia bacterium]